MATQTTKIKDLQKGDWFMADGITYKLISFCINPKFAMVEMDSKQTYLPIKTKVEKIDGFQLYLLNGGRIWD